MLNAAKTDPAVIRPSSYKKLSAHFCCNVDGCMITQSLVLRNVEVVFNSTSSFHIREIAKLIFSHLRNIAKICMVCLITRLKLLFMF